MSSDFNGLQAANVCALEPHSNLSYISIQAIDSRKIEKIVREIRNVWYTNHHVAYCTMLNLFKLKEA